MKKIKKNTLLTRIETGCYPERSYNMECVKQIVDPAKLMGIIPIPDKMKKSKVEVIVLPTNEPIENSTLQEKLQAIEELNGFLTDQSKKKLDEFEKVISRRISFRNGSFRCT